MKTEELLKEAKELRDLVALMRQDVADIKAALIEYGVMTETKTDTVYKKNNGLFKMILEVCEKADKERINNNE